MCKIVISNIERHVTLRANIPTFCLTRPKPAYGRQGLDLDRWASIQFTMQNELKTMRNHETNLKNYGNQPKTMKNHETTLKNHGNQPKTMKNQNVPDWTESWPNDPNLGLAGRRPALA